MLYIYTGSPVVSTTIQTQRWKPVGRDLYVVPQNSFERKGLDLSAKQHSSLAPVNITYIRICVMDYGLVMHAVCTKTQRCYCAGQDWASFLPI